MRAEMFVAGIGWVPVDPALATANKNRPVTAYLGYDPGDLLVLHVDVDLQLPFPDKVRESQLLQIGPYYWSLGKGAFDGATSARPAGELKTTPDREEVTRGPNRSSLRPAMDEQLIAHRTTGTSQRRSTGACGSRSSSR